MKYWNQKDIPYACCQLLTAINARIFLGKEIDFIPSKIKEYSKVLKDTIKVPINALWRPRAVVFSLI
jgi:hypothetical protein